MATPTKAQIQADLVKTRADLAVASAQEEYYREAYADSAKAILAADDIGWVKLGVSASDVASISLDEAKQVSQRLHGYAESNPLLVRGRETRCSYLFSSPYEIGTQDATTVITPQMWNNINKRRNQDSVFSLEALERIEGERYSAGQAFVLYDRGEKTFQQISFQEIGDIIYDPDDSTEVWYVRRDWSATVIDEAGNVKVQERKVYYPSSRFQAPKGGYASKINGIEVNADKRMIVERVNMQPGGNLGIPDSFAAAPWALAYSAYLSDGSKVLAALAEWAWVVKSSKRNPAERAAATVRSSSGVGGTLFTDADVSPMPSKDAIDLNTGRPLAAQVAASLGISVVLLLADPGQSGAYGTAQTLSDPNRRTMEARRQRSTVFLEHCLELLGVNKPAVQWPKMSPGTDIDEVTLVNMAFGTGLFHEDEVRPRLADLAHITVVHDDPPEGFMYPNNRDSMPRADVDDDGVGGETTGDKVGDVSMSDGSTPMSNGQGRDSLGLGNVSHRKDTSAKTSKSKS